MKKRKIIIGTVVSIGIIVVLLIAINFQRIKFDIRMTSAWNYKHFPLSYQILFEEENMVGFQGDGDRYTVIQCSEDYDLSKIEFEEYTQNKTYVFRTFGSETVSDNQYNGYIEPMLRHLDEWEDGIYLRTGKLPAEYHFERNDIDYCIEVERALDNSFLGSSSLFIMQDKETNRLYVAELFV